MVDLEVLVLTSCSVFLGPCKQLDQHDENSSQRHYLGIFLESDRLLWVELDGQHRYTATTV